MCYNIMFYVCKAVIEVLVLLCGGLTKLRRDEESTESAKIQSVTSTNIKTKVICTCSQYVLIEPSKTHNVTIGKRRISTDN